MSGVVTEDHPQVPASLPVLSWFFITLDQKNVINPIWRIFDSVRRRVYFSSKRRRGDFSFFDCAERAGMGCSLILLVGMVKTRLLRRGSFAAFALSQQFSVLCFSHTLILCGSFVYNSLLLTLFSYWRSFLNFLHCA